MATTINEEHTVELARKVTAAHRAFNVAEADYQAARKKLSELQERRDFAERDAGHARNALIQWLS